MTIYEDTNSKPLLDLLDRIHTGDMVLPDFQRDFVWEPSATQALIVSIANNYPAGSIPGLFIKQPVVAALHSLQTARAGNGAPCCHPGNG
jgi:hypothetical protein